MYQSVKQNILKLTSTYMYIFLILFVIKVIFLIFHQKLRFRTSLLSLTIPSLTPLSLSFLSPFNSTVMMSPIYSLLSFLNTHTVFSIVGTMVHRHAYPAFRIWLFLTHKITRTQVPPTHPISSLLCLVA